jgi:hypothetical protein
MIGKIGKPELGEPPVEALAHKPADFAAAGPAQSELRQTPFQEIYSRLVCHIAFSIGFPLENAATRCAEREVPALQDRPAQRIGAISRATFEALVISDLVDLPKRLERACFRHIDSFRDRIIDMRLQGCLHLQMSVDREVARGHKGAWQSFVVVPEPAPELYGIVGKLELGWGVHARTRHRHIAGQEADAPGKGDRG